MQTGVTWNAVVLWEGFARGGFGHSKKHCTGICLNPVKWTMGALGKVVDLMCDRLQGLRTNKKVNLGALSFVGPERSGFLAWLPPGVDSIQAGSLN